MLFEQPVLQYIAFLLEYSCMLLVWAVSSGLFCLEYFGRLVVWAASTGIFWLSAAPVCQVVLACFVNLSQKPAAEKVTNNQLYSVARFNIKFSLKILIETMFMLGPMGSYNCSWRSFWFILGFIQILLPLFEMRPENLICGLLPFKRQSFDQGRTTSTRTLICAQWSKSAFKSK